jgi:hypothetical protein
MIRSLTSVLGGFHCLNYQVDVVSGKFHTCFLRYFCLPVVQVLNLGPDGLPLPKPPSRPPKDATIRISDPIWGRLPKAPWEWEGCKVCGIDENDAQVSAQNTSDAGFEFVECETLVQVKVEVWSSSCSGT